MLTVAKVIGLFLGIGVVTPCVYFVLISCVGTLFSFTIDRSSWLVQTKITWIQRIFERFVC